MSLVTFDTLEFVELLEKNGFTEQQAKSLAELQKKTFNEALETQIATKKDINELEKRMIGFEGKMTLMHWMLAFNLAFTMAVLYKLLF
jgi:hypothetical protein